MKNNLPRKNLNVDKENLLPLWTLKEHDDVVLKLALFKNSVAFDITGQTIRLGAKTSVGLKEQNDGFTIDKNNLDIVLKNSILSQGVVELDLQLIDANGQMTTASFFILVGTKVLNDSAVEATNEFNTFKKTVDQIEGDYKNLKTIMLDENNAANLQVQVNKVNASLEQKVNKDIGMLKNLKRVPTITISMDDGWSQEITVISPILKKYKIPATCALITNNMTNISERLELQNKYGWEFASHTVDHLQLGTLTPEEMDYQLRESKKQMEDVGYKVNTIVYPVGSANVITKRLSKKYYDCGFLYDNKNNIGMLDSFSIHRIPFGSYYIGNKDEVSTLEYYKSKIDEAFSNNGWVIFCLHPYHADNDATQLGYLEEVIKYAQSKNFIFTTLHEGYKIHGNLVESGDSDSINRIVIDKDGNSNIPIVKLLEGSVKATDGITIYPKDKLSICQIGNYDNAGFPEGVGGIVETHRTNDFAFQYFYVRNNNNEYRRFYNGTSWSEFELMRDLISNTLMKNDTPITAFVKDKITITRIGNFDNAGFPEGKAGVLTTYRNGADDLFSYQTFLLATSGFIYKRQWKTTVWGVWELIATKISSNCFNLDMSTSFQKTPTIIDKYLYIEKFHSSGGEQPTLTKEIWTLSELSTNSASPTVLGTAGGNRNILGYIQDKALYICYSSVGNNYNSFFKMSFC
ncbi:polysaccharide deacetylase family protein [Clostridium tertium]|uniref:polysaccharide deacetylase family protein n=1 Tax=Clostridium tertium TaxID=1559 RepID=UPI001AE82852|nr:polysaccharide deacetylase family protein [Clostridium tertium]MBP1869022.1 peptidoglycan/xylan/chitin deacetylase (PgdA/CDA1 family) [Clostridium tertium]